MRQESEHEPSDADDRPLELHEPHQPDPPVDDDDRDPAFRERQEWTYPAEDIVDVDGEPLE